MDDMNKKQIEALNAAWAARPQTGALNDEELEGVSGGIGGIGGIGGGPKGAVMTGSIYVARCKHCTWRAITDAQGDYDAEVLVISHMRESSQCTNPDFYIESLR